MNKILIYRCNEIPGLDGELVVDLHLDGQNTMIYVDGDEFYARSFCRDLSEWNYNNLSPLTAEKLGQAGGEKGNGSRELNENCPNITRLMPNLHKGFKPGWLSLSDKDKEFWEEMVTLIKEGIPQYEIANKLGVSKSLISHRLRTKDKNRLSLGLTAKEVRRRLS